MQIKCWINNFESSMLKIKLTYDLLDFIFETFHIGKEILFLK